MEEVVIRKRREVTVRGRTYVRELYARGYLEQDGAFRLTRCAGRYGFGKPRNEAVNQTNTDRAAKAAHKWGTVPGTVPHRLKSRM